MTCFLGKSLLTLLCWYKRLLSLGGERPRNAPMAPGLGGLQAKTAYLISTTYSVKLHGAFVNFVSVRLQIGKKKTNQAPAWL